MRALNKGLTLLAAAAMLLTAGNVFAPVPPPVAIVKAKPPETIDTVQIRYWKIFYEVAGNDLEGRRLAAQCLQESRLNPNATSPVGAQGLCQFMPATWNEWGHGQNIHDPRAAIVAAHEYMAWLLVKTHGDYAKALAAYNSGLGSVRRAERLQREIGDADSRAWLNKYYPRVTGDANAHQTQTYVSRIEGSLKEWDGKKMGELEGHS